MTKAAKSKAKTSMPPFRKLMVFVRPEIVRLSWGTFFLALGSVMMLVFPQTVRMTIDQALAHHDRSLIDRMGLVMLVVLILQAIASAARYYLFTWSGERIVRNIRVKLMDALMHQEIGFFDGQMTGDLMSRLTSDATVLQSALSVNISMMLRNAAAAIGGLGLLFYTSGKLTFILLAALPPAALMAARFGTRVRGMSKTVQEAIGAASAVADESLTNIRTVRSFAAEKTEAQRYDDALDIALGKTKLRITAIARFMGGISLLGLSAVAIVLWYGARLVMDQQLTVGTLSAYVLYTLTVAVSVATLGGLWTDFMAATGAASRIFQILDREVSLPFGQGRQLPVVQGNLALNHVCFTYPQRPDAPIFADLNLEIGSGHVVAIVGPSGSGKSTIAALIQRFYDPLSGSVTLDQVDLRELSQEWLRKQIGTVSQEPVLMSTSIQKNIAYGRPEASIEDIKEAAQMANALEFIQRFPEGMSTKVGERGVQLSGGQKQRIAIARAMLKDPRILILDEATSALDAESEHLVAEALQRLMQGRTVLIIAHRLSTVRTADRVVVLDKGHIVQMGSHEELLRDSAGPYYNLVHKQMLS